MNQFNAKKIQMTKGRNSIITASKNPRNMKMFRAIIDGGLDSSVVDPDYINTNVEFVDDELETTLRIMTRRKINAFGNNISKSADCFFNNIIEEATGRSDIAGKFCQLYKEVTETIGDINDKNAMAVALAAIVRAALIIVLDEDNNVKEKANKSEKSDTNTKHDAEDIIVTDVLDGQNCSINKPVIRYNESDKAIVIAEVMKNLKCDRATAAYIIDTSEKEHLTGSDVRKLIMLLPDELLNTIVTNNGISNFVGNIINNHNGTVEPEHTVEEIKAIPEKTTSSTQNDSENLKRPAFMPPSVWEAIQNFTKEA